MRLDLLRPEPQEPPPYPSRSRRGPRACSTTTRSPHSSLPFSSYTASSASRVSSNSTNPYLQGKRRGVGGILVLSSAILTHVLLQITDTILTRPKIAKPQFHPLFQDTICTQKHLLYDSVLRIFNPTFLRKLFI